MSQEAPSSLALRFLAPVAATEFILFPKLPIELQIMVWEFARPPPRVIKLLISKDRHSLYSSAPIPSILHVCHLSRETGQRSYTLGLASFDSPDLLHTGRIWFDYERDFIYYSAQNYEVWRIRCEDYQKLRNVAPEAWGGTMKSTFFTLEMEFEEVRELMVVDEVKRMDGEWAWRSDFEEMQAFEWQGDRSLMDVRAEQITAHENSNDGVELKWSLERATRVGFKGAPKGES